MTENPSAGKPGVLRRYHVGNSPVNGTDPYGLFVNEGFVKLLVKMADKGLKKTIKSLTKRIVEHEAKTPSSHHQHEIKVFKAQLELAKKELEKRGLKYPIVFPFINKKTPQEKGAGGPCPLNKSDNQQPFESGADDGKFSIDDIIDFIFDSKDAY